MSFIGVLSTQNIELLGSVNFKLAYDVENFKLLSFTQHHFDGVNYYLSNYSSSFLSKINTGENALISV